jgi:hypothetical protein
MHAGKPQVSHRLLAHAIRRWYRLDHGMARASPLNLNAPDETSPDATSNRRNGTGTLIVLELMSGALHLCSTSSCPRVNLIQTFTE